VTFTFVDPGLVSLSSFETHLLAYASLFSALPTLHFVYIATRTTHFESARKMFLAITNRSPKTDPGEEVLRYFAVRKFWDAKQYNVLNQNDIEFLDAARKRFDDALTDIRYHQWAENRISSDMGRAEFRDLAPKGKVSFSTERVDGQVALFESRAPRRNQRIAETGVKNTLQPTFGSDFKSVFESEARQAEEK
jgi:hypothetical protein